MNNPEYVAPLKVDKQILLAQDISITKQMSNKANVAVSANR